MVAPTDNTPGIFAILGSRSWKNPPATFLGLAWGDWNGRPHDEHVFRPKTEGNILQGHKALDQQTRSGDKYYGQRDLRHHQHSPHADHSAGNHGPRPCLLEGLVQVDPGCKSAGTRPNSRLVNDRDAESESEHPSIDADSPSTAAGRLEPAPLAPADPQ